MEDQAHITQDGPIKEKISRAKRAGQEEKMSFHIARVEAEAKKEGEAKKEVGEIKETKVLKVNR